MRRLRWTRSGLLGLALVAAACGADDNDSGDGFDRGSAGDPGGSGGTFAGVGGGAGFGNTAGAGGSGGGGLPPEVETNESFELPHAGEHSVYVANPETDNVAVIDAASLGIHVVEAGDEPTFLQTLAGKDAAIVLNVGSADATIIRTAAGVSITSRVSVKPGSNVIAVNPTGSHAVVYYDPNHSSSGSRKGSFQDVTLIALKEGGRDASIPVTVGFRPSAVFFQENGTRAFVVTEDGVSVLDLAKMEQSGGGIAKTVAVGATGTASTVDVSITPDGRYALAREENVSVLRLVDLESGAISVFDLAALTGVPSNAGGDAGSGDSGTDDAGDADAAPPALPGAITDLDLAPAGDYALAVVRGSSRVLRLPIPSAFDNPASVRTYQIANETVGSVTFAPGGQRALLFTTVVDTNERITVLDLATSTHKTVQLRKAVRSVAVAPDGKKALILHRKLPGDPGEVGLELDAQIDRSYGYSLLDLENAFAKLEVTPVDLGSFALVPDGSFLFVLFDGPTAREVQRANLSSFFVDRYQLGSRPVSVGAVPATQKVFVGQEHPDGRIAFIDWRSGDIQSVTGFELNSRIRE
jgi:hypothetical protein